MKMMLIEDDVTMCSLLKTIFEMEGFQVYVHDTGGLDEIVEAVASNQPDILLLDVNLRGASGLDITKAIRHLYGNSSKILMSSGMPLKHESLEAGADDFILKPYMPNELIEKVNNLSRR